MWRLLTSEKIKVSLVELGTLWSIDDAGQAHAVLDAIEAAEQRAQDNAKQRAQQARR